MTRAPVFIAIVVIAALYATYSIGSSVYQHIIIGDVDEAVVFQHRFHTYIVDEEGSCKIPAWVGSGGTLVTTGDCQNEDWTVLKVTHRDLATPTAYSLCAKGHMMNCLVVSNTKGSSNRSLKKLVRQSLAKYANEDVAWSCGAGCDLIPAQFAYCIALQQFGDSAVPQDFSEETAKCKLLHHEVL